MADTAMVFGEFGGTLPAVTHRGRVFQSHLLTQTRKARFVNYLKQRDLSQLAIIRDTLGVDEYETQKKILFERFDRGEYAFYGPIAQRVLTQAPKVDESGRMVEMPDLEAHAMFAACVFDCTPEEGLTLLAECASEVAPIIARVLHESMPNLKPLEGSDPNGKMAG